MVNANQDPYLGDTSQQHESHTAPTGTVYIASSQFPFAGNATPATFGWKAWSYDPFFTSVNASASVSNTVVNSVRVETPGGGTFNNICLMVNNAGTGVTSFTVGIYDNGATTATRLAVSADQKALLATQTFITVPLTSPAVVTGDWCYVAFSCATGGTQPTLYGLLPPAGVIATLGQGALNKARGYFIGGASLPASYTVGNGAANNQFAWVALT